MGETRGPGRPTLFEQYLSRNPALQKAIDTAREKAGLGVGLELTDIATIEDLIEYACFELTRSKNEDLLRGRTFVEYAKAFTQLFEAKERIRQMKDEWELKRAKALSDRTEVEAFMSIIYAAITSRVPDISIRKALSDEIQSLYDKHYPEEKEGNDGTGEPESRTDTEKRDKEPGQGDSPSLA